MTNRTTRIAIVLFSYNRPQMLDIAYRSIVGADAIILVDDGSDVFSAADWAQQRGIPFSVCGPHRSVRQRLSEPAFGRLVNSALQIAADNDFDVVGYLCDDDLFTPQWPKLLRNALEFPDGPHIAYGRWRSFQDDLENGPMQWPAASYPTPLDWRKMTAGNFGHRIECFRDEGLRWSEKTVAVHDDTFVWSMHSLHSLRATEGSRVIRIPKLAGYRREHAYNMALHTSLSEYAIGAEKVLAQGALE